MPASIPANIFSKRNIADFIQKQFGISNGGGGNQNASKDNNQSSNKDNSSQGKQSDNIFSNAAKLVIGGDQNYVEEGKTKRTTDANDELTAGLAAAIMGVNPDAYYIGDQGVALNNTKDTSADNPVLSTPASQAAAAIAEGDTQITSTAKDPMATEDEGLYDKDLTFDMMGEYFKEKGLDYKTFKDWSTQGQYEEWRDFIRDPRFRGYYVPYFEKYKLDTDEGFDQFWKESKQNNYNDLEEAIANGDSDLAYRILGTSMIDQYNKEKMQDPNYILFGGEDSAPLSSHFMNEDGTLDYGKLSNLYGLTESEAQEQFGSANDLELAMLDYMTLASMLNSGDKKLASQFTEDGLNYLARLDPSIYSETFGNTDKRGHNPEPLKYSYGDDGITVKGVEEGLKDFYNYDEDALSQYGIPYYGLADLVYEKTGRGYGSRR